MAIPKQTHRLVVADVEMEDAVASGTPDMPFEQTTEAGAQLVSYLVHNTSIHPFHLIGSPYNDGGDVSYGWDGEVGIEALDSVNEKVDILDA
uniref:Uncharacterized protein n=4 Tax=Oryza TaxID=4527 RepID=Q6ZHF8_ORYSJ|nr:hypothetical protein [Oryza sativa Japonica Group]BAD16862.1 hypothetical protein [Oryza sativa Japonica Group]